MVCASANVMGAGDEASLQLGEDGILWTPGYSVGNVLSGTKSRKAESYAVTSSQQARLH